jgi:hypothetical protein
MPRRWRVAPHGRIPPGRAYCRASHPFLPCATVQAFPPFPQVLCPLLTSPMGSERITPLSANCRGTPLSEAHGRPPAVSGHPVRAETPDVYSTARLWMEDFTVACPLVPTVPPLVSGSCPSPRTFIPRCLQMPPREDTLALPLSFGSTHTWTGDFHAQA